MRSDEEHIHKRKRVHVKLEEYPHKHLGIRFLDRLLLVVAVIGPLMTLPQIIKIFSTHDATGVSALTWSLFLILGSPWIVYGVVHKEKPIVIAHTLWMIMNALVVTGALLY